MGAERRDGELRELLVDETHATDPATGIRMRYVKQYDIQTDTLPRREICLSNLHPPSLMDDLCEQRIALTASLLSKARAADWRGCADAAMDLREIEAKLSILQGK